MMNRPRRFKGVSQSSVRLAERADAHGWNPNCLYGPSKYLRLISRRGCCRKPGRGQTIPGDHGKDGDGR